MGDSGDLMIGEPVIAVGNALGLSHTVSTGIVSALHRDINPDKPFRRAVPKVPPPRSSPTARRPPFTISIQTDAAINPGNSGGPLLNAYGQVIGINTAVRGDAQNIGFAIPIDRLRDLVPELMNPSQATKVDVPLHLAERRSVIEPATVVAQLVTTGEHATPVDAIDGHRPTDIVDACAQLLELHAGQPFTVTYGDGRQQRLSTTATPLPDAIVQARQRFGLSIEQVTPMLAGRYHLAVEDGLFVAAVDRHSPGERAGLQPGDVVIGISQYEVHQLGDFAALAARLPPTGQVRIHVVRGVQEGYTLIRF